MFVSSPSGTALHVHYEIRGLLPRWMDQDRVEDGPFAVIVHFVLLGEKSLFSISQFKLRYHVCS